MDAQRFVELRKLAMLQALDRSGISYNVINNEIRLYCPNSPCNEHHKPTLYMNFVRQVGWCHYCEEVYSWKWLVYRLKLTYHAPLATAPTISELKASLRAVLGAPKISKTKKADFVEVPLPLGAVPAYRSLTAMKYCQSRGITSEHLLDYKVAWCPYGPYRGRLLFPILWNKTCIGWTTRSARPEGDGGPKYKHSPGFPGSRVLYPQENLLYARIIITEGVIPAFLYRGVATFGKFLHEAQLQIILAQEHVKQVVLLYDRDAWKVRIKRPGAVASALKAWRSLAERKITIGLILPPEKPQPDHFHVSVLGSAIERAAGKSPESSIWRVTEQGAIKKVL